MAPTKRPPYLNANYLNKNVMFEGEDRAAHTLRFSIICVDCQKMVFLELDTDNVIMRPRIVNDYFKAVFFRCSKCLIEQREATE